MSPPNFLRPQEASTYLRRRGIRASVKTLAKWRVAGRGPRYKKAGRDVIYDKDEHLDPWADARISQRDYGSTAELKAEAEEYLRESGESETGGANRRQTPGAARIAGDPRTFPAARSPSEKAEDEP